MKKGWEGKHISLALNDQPNLTNQTKTTLIFSCAIILLLTHNPFTLSARGNQSFSLSSQPKTYASLAFLFFLVHLSLIMCKGT
jgi:hypothetical protein